MPKDLRWLSSLGQRRPPVTVVDGAVQAARKAGAHAVERNGFRRRRGRLRHLKWQKEIDEKRRITLEIMVIPRVAEALVVPSVGYYDDEKIAIARCDWDAEIDGPLRKIGLISNHMGMMAGASFTSQDFRRDGIWSGSRILERIGLVAAEIPSPEFRIDRDGSVDKLSERLMSAFDAAYPLLSSSCQTTEILLAALLDDAVGSRLCLTHDQWIRATAACMIALGKSESEVSEMFADWKDRLRREKQDVALRHAEDFEEVVWDRYYR
jgi:hypothetical protein